jgi:hypothetical protein
MLLIWSDPAAWGNASADEAGRVHVEYGAYTQALIDSKELVNGDALQGNDAATTVRVNHGDRVVSDGPFAETKEWLGGYYTVDVPDLDRALELAATLPGAKRGWDTIEVRPVMEIEA